jgi:hypothetical protein
MKRQEPDPTPLEQPERVDVLGPAHGAEVQAGIGCAVGAVRGERSQDGTSLDRLTHRDAG